MDEDKEERHGFRVTDRRRFAESGEPRSGAPADSESGSSEPQGAAPETAPPEAAERHAAADEPVTFSTFVLGLSTQALLHLGEIANPLTSAVERDLTAAKQLIDILGILREKTRSNLDQGEETLLESVLYDLRLRYVELVRRETKEGT